MITVPLPDALGEDIRALVDVIDGIDCLHDEPVALLRDRFDLQFRELHVDRAVEGIELVGLQFVEVPTN